MPPRPLLILDLDETLWHGTPDPTHTTAFLWHRDRCSWHRDEHGDLQPRKPARKLRANWIRSRYPRERILAIDDRPQNWASGYGHLVRVTPWTGDPHDDELPRLARYLLSIADTPDLRRAAPPPAPSASGSYESPRGAGGAYVGTGQEFLLVWHVCCGR